MRTRGRGGGGVGGGRVREEAYGGRVPRKAREGHRNGEGRGERYARQAANVERHPAPLSRRHRDRRASDTAPWRAAALHGGARTPSLDGEGGRGRPAGGVAVVTAVTLMTAAAAAATAVGSAVRLRGRIFIRRTCQTAWSHLPPPPATGGVRHVPGWVAIPWRRGGLRLVRVLPWRMGPVPCGRRRRGRIIPTMGEQLPIPTMSKQLPIPTMSKQLSIPTMGMRLPIATMGEHRTVPLMGERAASTGRRRRLYHHRRLGG